MTTTRDDPHAITIFLAGDLMLGRGIDQILLCPADPELYEPYVRSALSYVELAERAHGPIERPVSYDYVWGDALDELAHRHPDMRLVNLETAVTASETHLPTGINYRMNPDNLGAITAGGIDCCSLANNHVLDWGTDGLLETLRVLSDAGIKTVGAGRDMLMARQPAIVDLGPKGRVLVYAVGCPSSGIPLSWAATETEAGVNYLADLSPDVASRIADDIAATRQPGDVVIVSIHWGGNWGFDIGDDEIDFAHRLIDDAQVDVVHGHSSHHAKGTEVYRDKLILYGCGDFLNDYEGITGHEAYRDDLPLMYFATLEAGSGRLIDLTMTPLRIEHFRLNRASRQDAAQLHEILRRASARFDMGVVFRDDGTLGLAP